MAVVTRYEGSAPLRGDAGRALEAAIIALTSAGFRLEAKTSTSAELRVVELGRFDHNNFGGVSRIGLTATGGRLSVTADLDALARFARFLRLPALVFFAGALAMAFSRNIQGAGAWIGPVVIAAIGLVILFAVPAAVTGRIQQRTRASLDTLVANVSAIGAGN